MSVERRIEMLVVEGRFAEAAGLLVRQRRFEEAGNCYVCELPSAPTPVGTLSEGQRRFAAQAATCYERSGHYDRAAGLLVNLGEGVRASAMLAKLGRRQDAIAARRGSPPAASPWPAGFLWCSLPEGIEVDEDGTPSGSDWLAAPTPTSAPHALQEQDPPRDLRKASTTGSWKGLTPKEELTLADDLAHRSQELGLGPLRPGEMIDGRYRLEGPLGEGGYAVVFRAMDLHIEEPVAIKLFKRDASDPTAIRRFKEEIRIARRLIHPAIVKTYEFGSLEGAPFITMELLDGTELTDFVAALGGKMGLEDALPLLDHAFAALGYVHDNGVVHRDIKPSNLFVLKGGRELKLMDFGIARHIGSTSLTRTGRVVGTPAFIAPERLRRGFKDLTSATDLYSMGVVLYRLLTGKLPFDNRDVATLFHQVLTDAPTPPSSVEATLPVAVDDVILRLLAKKPADRYQHADEVRAALRDVLHAARRWGSGG